MASRWVKEGRPALIEKWPRTAAAGLPLPVCDLRCLRCPLPRFTAGPKVRSRARTKWCFRFWRASAVSKLRGCACRPHGKPRVRPPRTSLAMRSRSFRCSAWPLSAPTNARRMPEDESRAQRCWCIRMNGRGEVGDVRETGAGSRTRCPPGLRVENHATNLPSPRADLLEGLRTAAPPAPLPACASFRWNVRRTAVGRSRALLRSQRTRGSCGGRMPSDTCTRLCARVVLVTCTMTLSFRSKRSTRKRIPAGRRAGQTL